MSENIFLISCLPPKSIASFEYPASATQGTSVPIT